MFSMVLRAIVSTKTAPVANVMFRGHVYEPYSRMGSTAEL